MYRFCCKTWDYSVLSASTSCNLQLKDLLRDNLVPRVLSYELGCKTGLRWVVKAQPRYSTRFAAMLQNKLEQVLFNIFWSKFLSKKEYKNKRKEKKQRKTRKRKISTAFLLLALETHYSSFDTLRTDNSH